jgi:hypothetical protein
MNIFVEERIGEEVRSERACFLKDLCLCTVTGCIYTCLSGMEATARGYYVIQRGVDIFTASNLQRQ